MGDEDPSGTGPPEVRDAVPGGGREPEEGVKPALKSPHGRRVLYLLRISPHPCHVSRLKTQMRRQGLPVPAGLRATAVEWLRSDLGVSCFLSVLVFCFFNRTTFFSNKFQPLLSSFPCPHLSCFRQHCLCDGVFVSQMHGNPRVEGGQESLQPFFLF